jgi:hypothetical protein
VKMPDKSPPTPPTSSDIPRRIAIKNICFCSVHVDCRNGFLFSECLGPLRSL